MNPDLFVRCRLLLFALLLGVTTLPAQDRRIADRFPSSAAAQRLAAAMDSFPRPLADRLASVIDSAANEALPVEPLFLRALEGRVKRADPAVIVTVVSRLRVAMRDVRLTLGNNLTVAEMTSAAAAVQAGITRESLAGLQNLRGKQTLTAPIDAWLGLVAHGAVPAKAWTRIEELARAKATDVDYGRLTLMDLNGPAPKSRP